MITKTIKDEIPSNYGSNSDKDKIRSRIQSYLGAEVQYPYGIMSTEITYIAGLTGKYQTLAIMQAALGHLVSRSADPINQQILKVRIQKLAVELQAQEIEAMSAKKAWSDKYGNLHYIKKGDKIEAKFDVQPVLPEPKCTLCIDGQITDTYGKLYPCDCSLGDKWTGFLEPDYTGPVVPKGEVKPKASKPMSPVVNITDYKEYTKVTTVNVPKYPKYENLYKWAETANDLNLQYGQASKEVYENVTGLPFEPKEPKEPTVTVKEVEQPTGRRFKEKI